MKEGQLNSKTKPAAEKDQKSTNDEKHENKEAHTKHKADKSWITQEKNKIRKWDPETFEICEKVETFKMNEGNSTEGSDQGHDDDDDGLDDMAGPERMLVSPPKSPLNKKVQDVVGLTLGGTWAMEGRARSLDGITALALAPERRQNENDNDANTDSDEGKA